MRSIAHISDLHFGRTDPVIVEALAKDLRANPASLIVVSGDLTQRARPWQYENARKFLDRLPQPMLVVPGNHDIPLYDVVRRFGFTFGRYTHHITPDLAPIYQDDELFVMGLNTARPFTPRLGGFWKDGRIGMEELRLLRQQTDRLAQGVFRVVVTHHPFVPPSERHRGDVVHGAGAALPVLRQCGIDLLLAGHLHIGYCDDVRVHHAGAECSILSVQAGSATSTRRREPKNTYNRLTVEPDHLRLEVRAFDAGAFATLEVKDFRRTQGVWQRMPPV